MKTKIIFTTDFTGKDSIFDRNSYVDQASISALSANGITNCQIIKGKDTEVIALNKGTGGTPERIQAIIDYFCDKDVTQLFLFLHSKTELPLDNGQFQNIGEFRGWNKLHLPHKDSSQSTIRIWSMTHEQRDDRGAYILTKSAYEAEEYETDDVCAESVVKRVQSIFLAEDIHLLWKQFINGSKGDILNELIEKIKEIQAFPFIRPSVNVDSFKSQQSLPLMLNQLLPFFRQDPKIFKSCQP